MSEKFLRTSEVAQTIGVHPNTVRLYEEWGFLPPVSRSAGGYRQFTQTHVEQMRLARLALQWPYPGGKQVLLDCVHAARNGNLDEALVYAHQFLGHVRAEQAQAETAVSFLEEWAQGKQAEALKRPLRIRHTAQRLNVTSDTLRNWEKSGLLTVPRDPQNGYRLYNAADIGRLRVIRVLRQAGYSHTAILRMLIQFDAGERDHLRHALDTPDPESDIYYIADNWLTTLASVEERACAIIEQLDKMINMMRES
ncbi:MAG: MerR family transcriptional regulator [Chloroflexota bacterium]